MKQRFLFCIIILSCTVSSVFSQIFRNEWIDFSKTYYRFTVVKDGVCRINNAELPIALKNANAQNFQLWKNGIQVPIYTSISSGAFGNTDFIEFWGQINDGKADSILYLNPAYQTNSVVSMETDSSTYFLTLNPGSANARLSTTTNDITGSPTPLPYFIDTLAYGFKERLWGGYGQFISDEYVLSSSYDKNEGWTTGGFNNRSFTIDNLKAYKGNDAPNMQFSFAGGADFININIGTSGSPKIISNDLITTTFANTLLDQRNVASLEYFTTQPISRPITDVSASDDISINISTQYGATILLGSYKLVYPHTFDFNNQQSFAFDMPANAAGSYLEISNFATGGVNPILVDITNGKRYECVLDNNIVKVKLQPTFINSKCVLYSGDPTLVSHILNFTTRQFNDYSVQANQANYIFIANSLLNSGPDNQVEAYRSYRASALGGSYKAITYDVEELTDQFGYGIYKHPIGVRNFLQYAIAKFTPTPKYVLILGHGVNYAEFYSHQGTAIASTLNMVPTFGNPASDVLLTAKSLNNPIPEIPIGRVSVVNSAELKAYLDKVKEFDILQTNTVNDQANKDWKKKALFLIGSGEDVNVQLTSYMQNYANMIKDTLVGADAIIYGGPGTLLAVADASVKNIINNGLPLLTYFGHASQTSLDFNLSNPNDYANSNGKYPIFSVSGCNAGNFFNYDESRITASSYTISEKFTLAPARGALGFVSSTHFGVVNNLDYYNNQFFIATGNTAYGKSIGDINKKAFDATWKIHNGEFFTRLTLEETTLHGDPAITLYTAAKPDYDMEAQNIAVSPSFVSVADDSFNVVVSVHNIGKATNDSVNIRLQWQDPSGAIKQIGIYKIKGVRYIDSTISVKLPVTGNTKQGTNYIIATVDADNLINEIAEDNNTATIAFQISPDEIRPVYPYPLSIVNTSTFKLVASTADPYQASRTYQVDMDTTELFNSSLLAFNRVVQVGGEVEFAPPITNLIDGKVYYWRVAPIINGTPTNYRKSSFLYNTTYSKGWGQSHLYQNLKSSTSRMTIDPASGKLNFAKISNNLLANNAYYFGDYDAIHGATQHSYTTTFVNGNSLIYGNCFSFSMTFNVFDTIHFQPLVNTGGLYNSKADCNIYNFTFDDYNTDGDKLIMDFMDAIPNGYYVVIKPKFPDYGYDASLYPLVYMPQTKQRDEAAFGPLKTVPDYLFAQGFTDVMQMTFPRSWTLIYKKNDQAHFTPQFTFSKDLYENISTSAECFSTDTMGSLSSPVFGPAKTWSTVHWSGHSLETVAPFPDSVILQVIAIDKNGNLTVKYNLDRSTPDFDISSIDASIYPNIQLKLITKDSLNATPWQLDSWRLDYTPQPEGALAPNLYVPPAGVTTNATGQPYKFGVAFKNVSEAAMNPLKLKLKLVDASGNERLISLPDTRSIPAKDTVNIYFEIPTDTLVGTYNIYLGINADSAQPEQYFFNNFLYKQFTASTPLPVSFLNFQATPNANNVSLQWQVANEAGANYYVVERSVDGITFSTIGKVPAYKNSALMNTYSLLDPSPLFGKNFYRIKILNQDGTSEFSEIRVVSFGKDNLVKIYPNPVQNLLNINIPSAGKPTTLILTNASGQTMLQTIILGSTQLGMRQFAAGIYYLQVKDATGSTTFRVDKQ